MDLWLDEHRGYACYWDVPRLRDEIQHEFFNIVPSTYLLIHGGDCLHQLWQEKRYHTIITGLMESMNKLMRLKK
ncbi:MAG: hypothetical protein OXC92_07790 [Flavobacteriaceae bacterium]|nr:hypothetical protein [Flavobacteriaceae bacterium]